MLFNSIEYALFLPIVFAIYWLIGYMRIGEAFRLKLQNAFVLLASYVFYGWWDWRFLLLIAFTSFCSWGSGLLITRAKSDTIAKTWLTANIVINIGILAVFKYYDFFVTEFGRLFSVSTDHILLRVILPVGISFYTFQALSYSIDVYRKKVAPTTDIIAFFAFIAFFPQLVAGPIERATNLLPQFLQNRTFRYEQASDGMRQILWGLFKKMVIADTCAVYVNQVWASYDQHSGSTLLLAAILFTFQIYGDFSGYSDIAIGTAKLFGIRLMRNFNNPYFSRDIAEFWRRWHISLTTWFRDYVYIPLGGSKGSKAMIIRNTFVIFLVSGLWHGANWTFLAWGAFHALLFLPLILLGWNRRYTDQPITWRHFPQILCTFVLVAFGLILFRAESISQAWYVIRQVCSAGLLSAPWIESSKYMVSIVFTLCNMLVFEWIHREKAHGFDIADRPQGVRWLCYIYVFLLIVAFGTQPETFIYFQF